MRKLILQMQYSIDGLVAGPNGKLDWVFPDLDVVCLPPYALTYYFDSSAVGAAHLLPSRQNPAGPSESSRSAGSPSSNERVRIVVNNEVWLDTMFEKYFQSCEQEAEPAG